MLASKVPKKRCFCLCTRELISLRWTFLLSMRYKNWRSSRETIFLSLQVCFRNSSIPSASLDFVIVWVNWLRSCCFGDGFHPGHLNLHRGHSWPAVTVCLSSLFSWVYHCAKNTRLSTNQKRRSSKLLKTVK